MSVLYCAIPHFVAALARRDDPELEDPLVLLGPEGRVFDASCEATACGIVPGMTARTAEVRCPEARLLDADIARCRGEAEALYQVLESTGPQVEPHGWGAAYVDLGDMVRGRANAISLCGEIGKAVRQELGQSLQPALGWDSTKFTAQAAAQRTQPGHLRAVDPAQERGFLQPLSVSLLPLDVDTVQRLCFLGLRTLGQYAALPSPAVWQQFGRAGVMAHRCARGEDDRPVIPRGQSQRLVADIGFETPVVEWERVVAALLRLLSPMLAELRGNLQTCGQVRLLVCFDGGSAGEGERTFLVPTADEGRVMRALDRLLDRLVQSPKLDRSLGITSLSVVLEQIQDALPEQLSLFSLDKGSSGDKREAKIREVQRYLAARFGANLLRRVVLDRPGAPLPEWRVSWQSEGVL